MTHAISSLAASGQVTEALARLRQLAKPSLDLQALQAELEAINGNLEAARRLAVAVMSRSGSGGALVRALLVAGKLDHVAGRTAEGQQQFRKARELAQQSSDPSLVAHAIGQHIDATMRFVGLEAVFGELGGYRRAAFRAATHASLVQLHKVLSQAELKSGRAYRSVRELELAHIHVEATKDEVLAAQLAVARSATLAIVGDFAAAYALAKRAVSVAGRCGAVALQRTAQHNIAFLQVIMGLHAEAERNLAALVTNPATSIDRELEIACNRLQLLTARRDPAARDLDDRYGPLASVRQSVAAQWYRFAQTEYLLRYERSEEAAALGLKCLDLSSRDDRDYLGRLQASTADAMVSLGHFAESARFISDLALGPLGHLPEFFASGQRIRGRSATDSPATALEHFDRAARVFGHIGHIVGRGEALHNAATFTAARAAEQGIELTVPHITTLYTAPPATFGRIDASAEDDRSSEFASAASIRAAAAMIDLVSRPLLSAFELSSLAARCGAAETSIVHTGNGKRPEAIGWTGSVEPDTSLLGTSESLVRFELGSESGREVVVVVRPRNQRSARTTLVALQRLVAHALTLHRAAVTESEKSALWPEPLPEQQLGLICSSESMLQLMKATQRVASSQITVLITGETGTGKELLAHALHNSSPRSTQRFLPFNCTAVARDMLDSQLFGYRRGAFTGAQDAFPGVIRSAAGGTLFLDEIGEIGLDVQPKLLRFLESTEVHPLGEPVPISVDVRIVAATNANLDALVADGKFREDLFYRLNVVKLTIPPLRERREEIPLLVEHFLTRCQKESGKAGIRVGETTAEYLLLYDWPGNVRELANEIRRAVALAEPGAVLMPEHLSPRLAATRRTVPVGQRAPSPSELLVRRDQPLNAAVEHVERALIQDALRRHGSVEEAARALGLSRKGLYLKRQRLQIDEQIAEA